MGDKTQLATVALAARYGSMLPVVAGTTLGMMIADTPAVILGERLAERAGARWLPRVAAVLFMLVGLVTMIGPTAW
jgi:putative Ca2+/H+ antiporter (TMEM165/GDT1 family)